MIPWYKEEWEGGRRASVTRPLLSLRSVSRFRKVNEKQSFVEATEFRWYAYSREVGFPWASTPCSSEPCLLGPSLVGRRERSFACATRAPRDTPALGDHGWRTALGCRCRGADCASRSSILPTAAPVRDAGVSEPDMHSVHAAVGCRGPAAAGRRRGGGAETGVRALPHCRAGVLGPADVAGSRGTGAAAVVRCEPGPTDRARCLPPAQWL
jgi:hypothetical protein